MPSGVYPRPSIEQRFLAHVTVRSESECWPWTGLTDAKGYGVIWWRGRNHRASHIALFLAGVAVPGGMFALHACDNPPCVNAMHLSVGTTQENTRQRNERGRQSWGEGHHMAKLSLADVQRIRELHIGGRSVSEISRLFRVQRFTIRRIVTNKGWRTELHSVSAGETEAKALRC